MKITYVKGDATHPNEKGNKIIVWGAGFVLALSKRWKQPEESYEEDITVANMIAQHGCGIDESGEIPLKYDFLKNCLAIVNREAEKTNAIVCMPRIGCGLAGGKWEIVEYIIKETMTVDVVVYDL
jgi:hypothetical protein